MKIEIEETNEVIYTKELDWILDTLTSWVMIFCYLGLILGYLIWG
jgi:hypothetical protein